MPARRSGVLRFGSALTIVVGSAGLLLASAGGAGASGGSSTSPPTSSVPTSCSASSTVAVPSSGSSSPTTASETCAYAANTPVTVTFGGATVANVTAGSNGLISLSFTGKDPEISVNGGPFSSAAYGVNTFVAMGKNASGSTNTATFLVDLEAPVSTAAATTSGGLAFTGADLLALIAAALVLILLGVGVVLYTRRRSDKLNS
jgi:hypothetical protein